MAAANVSALTEISHTTTPQGDLNMDGDRYDNTGKAIVYKTGANAGDHIQAFISHLDNVLRFSTNQRRCFQRVGGWNAIQIAGWDGSKYSSTRHYGSKRRWDVHVGQRLHRCRGLHGSVYKVQRTKLGRRPGLGKVGLGCGGKTQDEGHFYMECSNQGLCDRGLVYECFDGYTGIDCGVAAYPNDCSGNGRCMTIADMAKERTEPQREHREVARGSHFVFYRAHPGRQCWRYCILPW